MINNLGTRKSSYNKRMQNIYGGHDIVTRCTLMHVTLHPRED